MQALYLDHQDATSIILIRELHQIANGFYELIFSTCKCRLKERRAILFSLWLMQVGEPILSSKTHTELKDRIEGKSMIRLWNAGLQSLISRKFLWFNNAYLTPLFCVVIKTVLTFMSISQHDTWFLLFTALSLPSLKWFYDFRRYILLRIKKFSMKLLIMIPMQIHSEIEYHENPLLWEQLFLTRWLTRLY